MQMELEGRAFPEVGIVKYCEKGSRGRGEHVAADHSGHATMGKVEGSFR